MGASLIFFLLNIVILILGIVAINRSSISSRKKPLAYLAFLLVILFINWILLTGLGNALQRM